jgi:maltoporin
MKAMMKAATVVAALLAFATPAMAVDFSGYFRDGFSLSAKGGPAAGVTFQTPGMDYKLRLGNENDNYGEWGLEQTIYKDKAGVEFKVGVMFNYYQTDSIATGTTVPFGIQQNYVKAKFPQFGGATVWAGKQYYERENIDMIDHFYLNTSDPGIGVEDVDVGMGKISVSVFGVTGKDANSNAVEFVRPDVRWRGIPVWTNGTLMFDVNYQTISRHDGLPTPTDEGGGVWVTGEWHQDGILGGWNQLTLQFANGSNAGMGPGAPGRQNKNDSQFAVWEQLLLQPTQAFSVLVGGTYQNKTIGVVGASNSNLTSYGVFARPKFFVTDYFAIQGDIGYTQVKPKDLDSRNLIKWTIAPTILPAVGDAAGGFFNRPEIRVYVTGASWNDASQAAGVASGNFGTDKSGMVYGAQVETWF